jgi:Skp family chaperone for outer membrane proteins
MLYTDTWAKWRKGQKENEANIKRLQLKRSWMQEMFDKASQELRQARERQDVNQIQKLEWEIKDIISQTRQIINTPIWNFNMALDWERVDTEPSIETA